jgi:hypothetical protein
LGRHRRAGGRGRRRVGERSPRPDAGREVVVVAAGSGIAWRRRGRRRRGAMVACGRAVVVGCGVGRTSEVPVPRRSYAGRGTV